MTWQDELKMLMELVASAFKRQINVTVNAEQLIPTFDKAAVDHHTTINVQTARQDDHLRLRLYTKISNNTSIGRFRLQVLPGYGSGPNDEIWVASITIDKYLFPQLCKYIPIAQKTLQLGNTRLLSEDGELLVTEFGQPLVAS